MIKTKRNIISIIDDIGYIKLYSKRSNNEVIATVDVQDIPIVEKLKWRKDYKRKYVVATYIDNKYRTIVYLHRYLTNAPKGIEVDHIDGNPLNNCRNNLRFCTSQQNKFNKKFFRTNTFPGVTEYLVSGTLKFKARIVFTQNNKKIDKTKVFLTREEAVKQRLLWEAKYFKDFGAHNAMVVL